MVVSNPVEEVLSTAQSEPRVTDIGDALGVVVYATAFLNVSATHSEIEQPFSQTSRGMA